MKRTKVWFWLGSSIVSLITSTSAMAQPTLTNVGSLFPNIDGVRTDLLDVAQGGQIDGKASTASPIAGFAYDRAIGVGALPSADALFSDSGAAGTVQFFTVRTPKPITLANFNVWLAQDGPAVTDRSARSVRVYASNDNITYTEVSDTTDVVANLSSYGTVVGGQFIRVSDTPNVTAQFFRVETVKAVATGPRIFEFDGFGSVVPLNIDANLFNATTNTGGDEPAGLGTNFTASASFGGTDDPKAAFGKNSGNINPGSFLFGDGLGAIDNGNGTFDVGERVDSISWSTTSLINLAGYEIDLGGETGGNRGTELVRFLVENVQVDLFDANGMNFTMSRLFAGGPVIGNDFRIEFTRTSLAGPRIREINAILAPVPEPGSLAIFSIFGVMALLGMAWRQRHGSRC